MILRKTFYTILAGFVISFTGYSQNKAMFDEAVAKYPEESLVELLIQKNIELTIEDGKLKIQEKVREESLLLKDDATNYEKYSLYSNSFIKIRNIQAKTMVPKGNSYKSLANDNIEIQNDNSSSSFYDDQKKHIVHFDNLEKGAIRNIYYERTYEDPHFFGQEILCEYSPIKKYEINIKCAKSIDIAIKYFNADSIKSRFVLTEDSKFRYYTLKLENIPEYKNFKGSPGIKWYMPHVVFHVTSYNNGTETKDFLKDVSTLFSWYSGLINHLPPITNEHLKQITDSLTDNEPLEINKVRNVFYWVQKNIKYVAFEDGLGGFVPRDASLVFQKKYGDCKDMAFLIYSMLRYKKIDAYLTWIGSRNIPYTFSQVPAPLTDDHMIACYKDKAGNYTFLDATDKQIKFGWPSGFTQGKQGMLATTETLLDTAFVPVMPANRNLTIDSTYLKLENSDVTGKCRNYFTGYERVDFINDVTYLPKAKKEEYYKEEYEKGSNKFFVSNLSENFYHNDTTAVLNFDFVIKDYLKKLNNELFINLNIEQNTELYHFDDKFITPYSLSQKSTKRYVKILDIPAGYTVTHLPDNFTKKDKNCQISITYEVKNGKIINNVEIIIDALIVPLTEIPDWNKFVKEYRQQAKQIVVLKEK